MRIMALKIFVLACCLVLFLDLFIFPRSNYLKRKNEYGNNLKQARYFSGNCLMLGDSHGEALGLNINEINCMNISFGSDSIFEMYLKLLYVVQNNPKIDLVIIPADLHLFQEWKEYQNNQYFMHAFASVSQLNSLYNSKVKYKYSVISPIFDPNVYYLFRREVLLSFFEKRKATGMNEDNENSWMEFSPQQRKDIAKGIFYNHSSGESSPKLITAYKEIIDLCKRRKIMLVAIRFPLSIEYRENITMDFKKKILDIYADFNLPHFFDYKEFIDDPGAFRDQDHLNKKGAVLFKEKLAIDIKNIHV